MQRFSSGKTEVLSDIKGTSKVVSYKTITPYTLITGASRGIGLSFAHAFAKKGCPLIMVALPEKQLEEVASAIREQYQIPVDYLGIDLTADHAPRQVWDYCQQNGYTINRLINNAGIGFSCRFENLGMDKNLAMIKLNTQAMVGMTHYFLPRLLLQPDACILFMSSMEATLALPYKSVYTGTKNFIYSFALALREELKKTSVKVHVVCPGPVLTNADGLKRINAQGWKARMLLKSPDIVAAFVIRKMEKNKVRIIPGRLNRFMLWLANHLPLAIKMHFLERIFRRFKDHEL
ncbi:MAG: SDR family NAD(P)-dependent oxidoreductase, partial [Chitinophagaceae bacterium]